MRSASPRLEVLNMKKNVSQQSRNLTRLVLFFAVPTLAALLFVMSPAGRGSNLPTVAEPAAAVEPETAFQIPRPWTAVGSTGAVDESSLNLYAFGNADIGFRPGAPGSVITARYNVTNTFDNNANPNRPGWTILEMGSNAPVNTIIEARLFQIQSCTQQPVLICTARNRSMDSPCARCTFPAVAVDFTSNLYYVEVTLTRPAGSALMPRMFTLRLF